MGLVPTEQAGCWSFVGCDICSSHGRAEAHLGRSRPPLSEAEAVSVITLTMPSSARLRTWQTRSCRPAIMLRHHTHAYWDVHLNQ